MWVYLQIYLSPNATVQTEKLQKVPVKMTTYTEEYLKNKLIEKLNAVHVVSVA